MGVVQVPAGREQRPEFTVHDHVRRDRELVLSMLRREDRLIHAPETMRMYADPVYAPRSSLTIEHALQRLVLAHFGFSTSDHSLRAYRSIFRHYYSSPRNHDAEVMSAVTYLRENKLLYYTAPPVEVGQEVGGLLRRVRVVALPAQRHGGSEAAKTGVPAPALGNAPTLALARVAWRTRPDWKHLFVCAFSTT